MQMPKDSAAKLPAIGYAPNTRTLRVELDGGSALEYAGVSEDLWRRFKSAGAHEKFVIPAKAGIHWYLILFLGFLLCARKG